MYSPKEKHERGLHERSAYQIRILERRRCWLATPAFFSGKFAAVFLTCGLPLFFACGPYSFSSSGNSGLKTVAVPVFNDQTAEFGIKEQLTNAVIEAFTRDNNLKIADRRVAEAIVNGTLLRVVEQAGVYTKTEQVQEIRVALTVRVKYEDVKKRKVIWEEELTQFGTYSPGEAGSGDRESAISQAVAKIAAEILNKSVSGW